MVSVSVHSHAMQFQMKKEFCLCELKIAENKRKWSLLQQCEMKMIFFRRKSDENMNCSICFDHETKEVLYTLSSLKVKHGIVDVSSDDSGSEK